jgi:hypothetical protein
MREDDNGAVYMTKWSVAQTGKTFTRPADATAYASGDLVANNVTAGSVVPLSFTTSANGTNVGGGQIRRVRLSKSGTSVTNAAFRVHFYSVTPVAANGDNGVWSTSQAAAYLGSIDVTVDKAFTDGASGSATGEINFIGSSLFALIEARGAYTPANAETFTLTLEIV